MFEIINEMVTSCQFQDENTLIVQTNEYDDCPDELNVYGQLFVKNEICDNHVKYTKDEKTHLFQF